MLEQLAESNADKVRIIKVNAEDYGKWAMDQNVRGVPAFRLYSGGMLVDQFAGAYPEPMLQGKIDKYAEVLSGARASKKPGEEGEEGEEGPPPEPAIRPMPKNWLPPGVSEN